MKLKHLNGADHTTEMTETGSIDFLLQRSLTGEEDLQTHSPLCVRKFPGLTNKINSTKRMDSTQIQNLQEQLVKASSQEFALWPFHSISVRAVQYSICINELHPIHFLSQAINWRLTNDLSPKLMVGLENTWESFTFSLVHASKQKCK